MIDDALIEAMARAIARTYYDGAPSDLADLHWDLFRGEATAALEAIRKTHAVVPLVDVAAVTYTALLKATENSHD